MSHTSLGGNRYGQHRADNHAGTWEESTTFTGSMLPEDIVNCSWRTTCTPDGGLRKTSLIMIACAVRDISFQNCIIRGYVTAPHQLSQGHSPTTTRLIPPRVRLLLMHV